MHEVLLTKACWWSEQQIHDLEALALAEGCLRLQIGVFIESHHMITDATKSVMPQHTVQPNGLFLCYIRHFVYKTVGNTVDSAIE
ncbi:hypothetical protein D3C80_2081450 [compost metagenome]